MNFAALDLNLLRVLDALLSEGSTVAAGRKVGLSQPAVSAALGRLRHALGDPLFVRRGQGIEPTDFARDLKEPLAEALAGLARLLEPKAFDPATAKDSFLLSGTDFFAIQLMPDLAQVMAREAPGLRVQLVDLDPASYIGTLEAGRADLALVPRRDWPDWVETEFLFWSDFSVIARRGNRRLRAAGIGPDDPMPLDLFCDLPQVMFSPDGALTGLGDAALAKLGRSRRIAMTLATFSALVHAVADSDLISLVPEQFATAQAERFGLDVYDPPMPIAAAPIVMAWHRRATENPAHRWLRERIGELMRPLDRRREAR